MPILTGVGLRPPVDFPRLDRGLLRYLPYLSKIAAEHVS